MGFTDQTSNLALKVQAKLQQQKNEVWAVWDIF
jgi:hypothetical protein